MVVVDSSVWIAFFNGVISLETEYLVDLLRRQRVIVGDLVMTEVLQGFRDDRQFERARHALAIPQFLCIADRHVAELAARNYRTLRAKGITVRKTIDTLIATRCILDGHTLLYSDRDFDPFVAHLGLKSAMDLPGVVGG